MLPCLIAPIHGSIAFSFKYLAYQALYQKAEIYYSDLFDIENAMRAFDEIIAGYPKSKKYVAAHFRNGDCHLSKGDIETAIQWYTRGRRLSAANPIQQQEGVYKTAYAYFLTAEYEQSLNRLNEIVSRPGEAGEQGWRTRPTASRFLHGLHDHCPGTR